MRKLKVTTFLTLDGVMQAPGGPEEDPDSGFDQGGWSVGYWDDQVDQEMGDFMGTPFDLVLGRKTYEIFASFWPNATEEQGAKPMNDATKNVASRTLKSLEWANSVLLEGDVVEGVRALKQSDGPELQIHGSSNLIQSLLPHNVLEWIGRRPFRNRTIVSQPRYPGRQGLSRSLIRSPSQSNRSSGWLFTASI
jgi:dihydrofolate reductase